MKHSSIGDNSKFSALACRRMARRFLVVALALLVQSALLPLAPAATTLTWDINSGTAGPQDGNGNWDTTTSNWWNGIYNLTWTNADGNSAIFGSGGQGGTVSVAAGITVANITINTNYIFSGNSLTLVGSPILTAGTSSSNTIGSLLAGTGFTKEGAGVLVLNPSSPNTYIGLTIINNGILQCGGNDSRIYVNGDLQVNPAGTFRFTSGGSTAGVMPPSSTLIVNGGTVLANVSGKYLPITKLVLDNNGAILMAPTAAGNFYCNPTNIDARSGYIYANLYRGLAMNTFKSTAGTVIVSNRPNTSATDGYVVNMNAGTLIFDKSSQNANRLVNNAVLTLGGGSLVFSNGNSGINPTAEFPGTGGTTINPGASSVSGNNAGALGGNVVFGAFNRKIGGTFDVATKTGAGNFSTASALNNGILGGWGTWAGADWLTLTGTNLVAYSAYATGSDPTTWLATDNVSQNGSPSANLDDTTINSLKLAAAATVTINSGKTLTLSSGGLLVTGSGATAITGGSLAGGASGGDLVVIQNSSADLTLSSTLSDNGGTSLTKSGSGKLILSPAANNLTGTNYLNGGVVEVSDLSALASGPLVMNNGALRYTGSDVSSSRTITVNGLGGTFDVAGSAKLTQNGAITGSGAAMGDLGGITKTGSGTLALTASNNFNGSMVISNGTLLVNGTNNYAVTNFGAGLVTVYGGTLGGTGTIMGPVTVKNGGAISPGASLGTLTLATNLTWESGSANLFEVTNAPGASDQLVVQGNLSISNGCAITLSIPGTPLEAGTYTLIQYSGKKTGSFNPTPVISAGSINGSYIINDSTPGQINLVVTHQVTITSQPVDAAVSTNDPVSFAVTATGTAPLSYQWYFYGDSTTNPPAGLQDATNATFSIANAQGTNNGFYSVVVSNNYNSVTSRLAVLVVGNLCPILSGPSDAIAIQGNNQTFSTLVILANPQPTFQWQTNGTDVAGATNSSLTLSNVQYVALNGATVSVIVSNAACLETNSATLTVYVTPTVTLQPTNQTVNVGDPVSIVAAIYGVPTPTLQWYRNNVAIQDETNTTLSIASAQGANAGTYKLIANNDAGSVQTAPISLKVVSTTLSATALAPANGASGVCYDTPLYVTFNGPVSILNSGRIRIYNANNSVTPVDTIDMSSNNVIVSVLNTGQGITLTNNIQPHSAFPGDNTAFNYFPVIISNNVAAIYPHGGVLTSNQTYYVTIESGVVNDSAGAQYAGLLDTNAWRFTTKLAGPANPTNLVVAADGSGDFVTVQGAADSIPLGNNTRTLINVGNGNYVEIVNISGKSNIVVRGQSRLGTVIGYGNNANIAPGGSTGSRMAFKVNGNDIAMENLTLVNRTPQGGSQAETLMINTGAARCIVNNCDVNSLQDTILANVNSAQVYFNNSTIRGNFDYVWGGGNVFLTNCLIYTVSNIYVTNNYNLTASRTDFSSTSNSTTHWLNPAGSYTANGIDYVNCRLQADPTVTAITLEGANGTANGLASFISCWVDTNHYVAPAAAITNTYVLWQYNNSNIDGSAPASFGLVTLMNNDPRLLVAQSATNWLYGWQPGLAPNILSQPTDLTVGAGQPATFTVAATGIPDPAYQWQLNGTNLVGQTGSTLSLASASGLDAGTYSAIVSNSAGVVTSSNAVLTVTPPTTPATIGSPTVAAGGNVQFTINGATGSAGFGYRVWATTNIALTPVTSTWTLLTNDVFGVAPVIYTDTTASGLPQRFYLITVP